MEIPIFFTKTSSETQNAPLIFVQGKKMAHIGSVAWRANISPSIHTKISLKGMKSSSTGPSFLMTSYCLKSQPVSPAHLKWTGLIWQTQSRAARERCAGPAWCVCWWLQPFPHRVSFLMINLDFPGPLLLLSVFDLIEIACTLRVLKLEFLTLKFLMKSLPNKRTHVIWPTHRSLHHTQLTVCLVL